MPAHPVSTIRRPQERLIQRFEVRDVRNDTVRTYLQKGWSLGIACKGCSRLTEWTPPELLERFAGNQDLRLSSLVPRLACTGPGGCGSKEVAVFPHPYDGPWSDPTDG